MDRRARIFIVIVAVTDLAITISARKVFNENKRLMRRYKILHETAVYLVDIAERQGLTLNEFDLIALNTIKED